MTNVIQTKIKLRDTDVDTKKLNNQSTKLIKTEEGKNKIKVGKTAFVDTKQNVPTKMATLTAWIKKKYVHSMTTFHL